MLTRRATSSELADLVARARAGLEKYEAGQVSAAQLAKGLRLVAERIERAACVPLPADVALIFDKWVVECGKDPQRTKLTGDRRSKIEARLRDGYTRDEIIVAVMNVARSPFHRGDNDRQTAYDDITLICRDGAHLERFRDMGPERVPEATGQRPLPLAEPRAPQQAGNGRYTDKGW